MNYPQQPGPHPQNRPPQQSQPYQRPYPPRGYPPPPQPHPQQPYAPQQPQQYAPVAEGVAVTTQFFPLSFMLAFFKPKISIDGYETTAAAWGRTVLPAQPGRHRVHVHVPYLLPSQIGPADTVVDVYPGRVVELEYKAPVWGFCTGSLGPSPQTYNGVGITLAIMGLLFAVPVFFVILMVIFSL